MLLRRNEKVDGAAKSIWEPEYRFNHRYGYPWVFDEVGFMRVFKESVRSVMSRLIRLKASRSGDLSLVANGLMEGNNIINGCVTVGSDQ